LVLDTNTVVSGLFWDGSPSLLQDAARAGKVELYTSPALLTELARVLGRRKFSTRMGRLSASVGELIEGYGELAQLVRPASIAPMVLADPDDDHVLACASPPRPISSSRATLICSTLKRTGGSPSSAPPRRSRACRSAS
jgi:putative PIN family toxin of toxin-antitoxin system